MITSTTIGPEKATFVERFVALFRIPYIVGSMIIALVVGPPGAILSVFACTRNFNEAFTRTVILFLGSPLPFWQSFIGLSLLLLILYYFLFMIRYMRVKLVRAEDQLIELLPEGEDTFDNIFGLVSKTGPPIIFGLIFMVLFSLQVAPELPDNFKIFCTDNVTTIFLCLSFPIWFVIFSTFVWIYIGSIRGLCELGKKVNLKGFHEDKMLGVRPIGSLSLHFAYTFFTGLIILALLPAILTPESSLLGYMMILTVCTILGLILFFLPLYTIHKKMVEAKQKAQDLLRGELSRVVKIADDAEVGDSESISEIKDALNRLTTVLTVEVTKDEVENMPTWPMDTQILSRLVAMAVSIVAVIIAQYIMRKVIFLIPS